MKSVIDFLLANSHTIISLWVMLLLTYSVLTRSTEGVVAALVGLAGTIFTATGIIHGWKKTTKIRNEKTEGFRADV